MQAASAAKCVPDARAGPVELSIARERFERLLKGQPEKNRRIIQLRLEGRTQADIARSLGIAEITVRRTLKMLLQATDE